MLKVLTAGILLTALYNFLVFNSQPGIGFSLFAIFTNWTVFLFNKNAKNPLLSFGFGISSSIFALLFSFRSNGVVQIVDAISAIGFLLLNIYFAKSNLKFDFSYLSFLTAPLKAGTKFAEGVLQSFVPQTWATEHSANKHITSSALRGVFIGLPILAVLFFILSKADPIFENITTSFLDGIWWRSIFSIIIFISALSLGIMKIHETEKESESKEISAGKEYELLVILGSLTLLFAGFIFIQFKYLFSGVGERELMNLGIKSITYSEYVRKGFFELLLASVVSSGVIFYALQYIHKLKDKGKLLVQIFTSVVTLEVGLLLWSAAQRVILYYNAHGLTRARVFGMFFLAWLALLLIILLIRILRDIKSKTYLTLNIISTILILALVNCISVDGLIAGSEHKPTVNNEIDYYYLAYLSPDASESWIPAIKEAEKINLNLKDKTTFTPEDYRVLYWNLGAIESINNQVYYLQDKYGSLDKATQRHTQIKQGLDPLYMQQEYKNKPLPEYIYQQRKWQSWNLGEYTAHQRILENPELFNKVKDLLDSLKNIQSRISPEVVNSAALDRSTSAPLSN